jgi:hypothetical protein
VRAFPREAIDCVPLASAGARPQPAIEPRRVQALARPEGRALVGTHVAGQCGECLVDMIDLALVFHVKIVFDDPGADH